MKNNSNKIVFYLLTILFIVIIVNNNRVKPIAKNIHGILDIFNDVDKLDLEDYDLHVDVEVIDNGYVLYEPSGSGYRYGPTLMYYDDGSIDAWFSSPGNNSTEWDYIRYRHRDNQGNWSSEKVVLKPTNYSLDHYSVCDPGVIYFNGYYYLGYTSTVNSGGYDNNIFVCRSKNPDGPFEKWDGNKWGGNPYPIINYDGDDTFWGAGEISFCIKEDTLYCYYTWISEEGWLTKVATADLVDDWPSTLKYQGIAFNKGTAEDSCDVVYLQEYDMFIALAIEKRFSSDSAVVVYESKDGLVFNKVDSVKHNVVKYAHNMGISKKMNGSIALGDDLFICYAYGDKADSKHRWSTVIQPVKIDMFFGKIGE